MSHLIADNATQFSIDLLVILAVAYAAEIKVRAIADIQLVLF